MKNKKRFFIVDPSFQDWLGHHAPYDFAVAEGLRGLGLEVIILAHKSAGIESKEPGVSVERVFSHNAWGTSKVKSKPRKLSHKLLLLMAVVIRCFPLPFYFFFYPFRSQLKKIYNRVKAWRRHPTLFSMEWRFIIRTISRFIPPFFRKIIRLIKNLLFAVKESLFSMRPPHWLAWLSAINSLVEYYELLEALDAKNFSRDDIVFAHMITNKNLPVWGLFASRLLNNKKSGEAVLLFRFICDWMFPEKLSGKISFRLLEEAFLKGKVRGATDSTLLAEEYAKKLAVPLVTFPIPHIPHFSSVALKTAGNKPLRCVSLGNARAEKGIITIINAIRLVNEKGNGHLFSFGLQLNDPDELCKDEVENFIKNKPYNVDLYLKVLSPDDYEKILLESDVVLTPYLKSIYYSRTSGVLLEAMAAGKIVICTKGTWMEQEALRFNAGHEFIDDSNYSALSEALCKIAQNPRHYADIAETAAEQVRDFHNPDFFAKILLYGPPPKKILNGDNILICYPFANLVEQKSGSSIRESYLKRALSNYKITFFVPPQECTEGQEKYPAKLIEYKFPNRTLHFCLYTFLSGIFYLFGDKVYKSLLAFFNAYQHDRKFRLLLIQTLLGNKGVIVEYTFNMKQIAPYAKALGLPVLITALDRLASLCKNQFRYKLIDKWEKTAFESADLSFTVAKDEHEYFIKSGINNVLSPNPVDIDIYNNIKTDPSILKNNNELFSSIFFLFVGSDHEPNILAKKNIIKISIEAERMKLPWKFVVAGSCSHLSESRNNFIALGKIETKLLYALYKHCYLILSPLFSGTGSSLKTVEAFGYGKIILGAEPTFRGLSVTDGVECFIENNLDNYIPRLNKVLNMDKSYLKTVEENALKFVANYDYRICLRPYVDFLETWPDKNAFDNRLCNYKHKS